MARVEWREPVVFLDGDDTRSRIRENRRGVFAGMKAIRKTSTRHYVFVTESAAPVLDWRVVLQFEDSARPKLSRVFPAGFGDESKAIVDEALAVDRRYVVICQCEA